MILPRSVLREERGSALLISLVMIVIITILGLALFELGQLEGQQSGASLGDARAFELAQAGLERAIRELQNAILADEAAQHGSESWVDGPNRPTCTPACETAVYHPMNLANATLPTAARRILSPARTPAAPSPSSSSRCWWRKRTTRSPRSGVHVSVRSGMHSDRPRPTQRCAPT